MAKLFSELSPRTQAAYKREGVSAGAYNARQRLTPTQRALHDAADRREAVKHGARPPETWQEAAKSRSVVETRAVIASEKIARGGKAKYWTDTGPVNKSFYNPVTERAYTLRQLQKITGTLQVADKHHWTNSQLYYELRDAGFDHKSASAIAYT